MGRNVPAGGGTAQLIDTIAKPSVVDRARRALIMVRRRVYIADGAMVWDMTLREFLARGLPGEEELLVPINVPAIVRVRLLMERRPVLLVPPYLSGADLSTHDRLRTMLNLPSTRLIPATEEDEAIAVLTLLYRATRLCPRRSSATSTGWMRSRRNGPLPCRQFPGTGQGQVSTP